MRNYKVFLMILAMGFLCGLQALAFSETSGIDPRDVALDKTLGGMAEGSRILSPHAAIDAGGQRKHGTPGSHAGSAAEIHQPAISATAPQSYPAATEANHGVFVHGSGSSETALPGSPHEGTGANIGAGAETALPGGNVGAGSSLGGSQEPITGGGSETSLAGSSHEGTGANIEIETGGGHETVQEQETPSGSTGGGTGENLEGPTGGGAETGGEHSIIEVNADANLNTDNPTVNGDIAIDTNAGGGLLDANTETTTDVADNEATSGTNTQVESVGSSGSSQESTSNGQNSIIEVNANTNLSSENPDVTGTVKIDPNASGGLIDAEAAASTDIIEQELTSNAGLQVDTGTDTTASETTTVGTETGSTNVSATNEVTGGVEADVDGAGAGDDVECNAADGLPCPPKL